MKRMLTSCFGLGFLPLCPGTFGSLPPVVICMVLAYLGFSAWSIVSIMLIFVFAGAVVCVLYSPAVIAETGKKDPGEIVADEFAGQAVAFLVIPYVTGLSICAVVGLAFAFFRLFDITKPLPIRKLEKLPKGWGILADDLMAGVYAAISLVIAANLWQFYSEAYSTI